MCCKALTFGRILGIALMGLSKASDCTLTFWHYLLIAKLPGYRFGHCCLLVIHSYLSNGRQLIGVGCEFSEWLEIKSGVRQGSVLGFLLLNTFINDLLLEVREWEILNFADDATIYQTGNYIESVILSHEETCLTP